MFEHMTYEYLMNQTLSRVVTDVDKRQGSVIWDALAPACVELAEAYIILDRILKITFAESSFGVWLEMRCAELGVFREPATAAFRLGVMRRGNNEPFDIPIGSRFSIETINYEAVEKLDSGMYKLCCEAIGIIGNQLFGRMTPIETIRGLGSAELTDILIPGEDAESDEVLYYRYQEAVNSQPYGGNIADYKRKVRAIEGVGDCKVVPVWNGGGTVKVVIITTDFTPPSQVLVDDVQERLDPEPFHQMGKGLAPIGHWVTVAGVRGVAINIVTTLQLQPDMAMGAVYPEIESILTAYFHELSSAWADEDNIIVRASQIEAKILNVKGIIDISGTTLNGITRSFVLGSEEIPIFGGVTLDG